MTTLQDLRQRLSRFTDGLRRRRQLERELEQLAAMGCLDATLADLGLVHSQVEPLIAGSAASEVLLDQMLVRLGIDAAQIPVETHRDLTWTCTTCSDKGECRKWFAGKSHADFHTFCPNAGQLDQLTPPDHRTLPASGSPGGDYHPSADDLRRMNVESRRREVSALLNASP